MYEDTASDSDAHTPQLTQQPDQSTLIELLRSSYIRYNIGVVYMGGSDVTESMVTIRSPFCGYNSACCMELKGEICGVIHIKLNQLGLLYENVHTIISLPIKRI